MKTNHAILWLAAFAAGISTTFAQTSAAPTNAPAPPAVIAAVADTNAPAPALTNAAPEPAVVIATNGPAAELKPGELRLNFRGASLETVLNYLSDAAGFIIVLDTPVRGKVDVWSNQPVTRDEAVTLLNAVLNKNGYAAIRNDRTLTIVDKNEAKTRDVPVKVSNDPDAIPNNDEIVTQIIPIRFVEAEQLVKDLSPFVSPQATVVANSSANSIVITDTQSNIRHLVKIIRAIDNSAEGETQIRVFNLKYANPTDVANELAQIFPSGGSSGNNQNQSPIRFGGGGGGPGQFFARMMGGGGGGNTTVAGSQNAKIQKQSQVIAVADLRISSVVVTAAKDLMEEIAGMMAQLDVPSTRDQKVFVYHMSNGDPQQALSVLQNMFGGGTTSRSGTGSSSQNSALQNREIQNATTTGSSSSSSSGFGTTGMGGNTRGGGQAF